MVVYVAYVHPQWLHPFVLALFPDPSHCPVFDCLQCAKMKKESLGVFITYVMSMSTRVDGGGRGVLKRKSVLHTDGIL